MPKNNDSKVMKHKTTKPKKKVVKTAPKVPKTEVAKPEVAKPEVAKTEVAKTDSVETNNTPYSSEFHDIVCALDTALLTIREMKGRLQRLEKQVHRDHRAHVKKTKGRKKRVVDPNAEPTGFKKPGKVSPALRKFLSLGPDEEIARTTVTQKMNSYFKDHNLQDASDKRKILPDAPLKKLLNMKKGDELTFFNLQRYMKVHFPNKEGVFPTA